MTQTDWLVLAFKVSIIAAFVSIALFVAVYTRLAPWWRNPIGQTIVVKDAIIAVLLIPSILSLFFGLNRLTSEVIGWIDVALIAAISPVMCGRIAVWRRIRHNGTTGTLPAGESDTTKE